MEFRATVVLGGKTATGIQVPDEVVAKLDAGKRPPVVVTVGGYSYRTTVAVMGGGYFVPLAAEHREAAGVLALQEVDVDIELDTAPRVIELPDVGSTRVVRIPIVVVFPAPFGPSRPNTSPRSTVKEMPSTALDGRPG